MLFIDDGIGATSSYDSCKMRSDFVYNTLAQTGFVVNIKKSVWNPTQEITWLGITMNLKHGSMKVAEHRISKIKRKIAALKLRRTCFARDMAALAGGIISMSLVHGPITSLFTRNMYQFINQQSKWDTVTKTPADLKSEIRFWNTHISVLNIRNFPTYTIPTRAIAQSDASNAAYGPI